MLALPGTLLLLLASALGAASAASAPAPSSTTTPSAAPLSGTTTATVAPGGSTLTPSGSARSGGSLSASVTSTASWPSLSQYSDCVNTCYAVAVGSANCSSLVDVNCYCSPAHRANFSASIYSCVAQTCPGDLKPAEALAVQFCGLAASMGSASLTFPTYSVSPSSSATQPPSMSGGSSGTSGMSTASVSRSTSGSVSGASTPTSKGNAAVGRGAAGIDRSALLGLLVGAGLAAGAGMVF